MENILVYGGIDMGVYTTTLAAMDATGGLVGIHQIYNSEDEYPRTPRQRRKVGQRLYDPCGEQIAMDHWKFMNELIDRYHFEAVSAESMIWTPSGSDTHALTSHFRGVMHASAIFHDIPLILISPQEIKKAATGSGGTNKNAVVDAVYERYGDQLISLDEKYTRAFIKKNNHIADAIGAALHLVAGEMNWLDVEPGETK